MSTNYSVDQYARILAARFGAPVWLVGSSIEKEDARDVDIRIILPDAQFAARYGSVDAWRTGESAQRWVDDVAHFSTDAVRRLERNVDLQIWPASHMNPEGPRRLLAAPRVLNADVRLLEFARAELGRPFKWGVTDCASLVRRATEVMYGADLFESIASWKTRAAALKAQRTTGGVRGVMLELGARVVSIAFAQCGDVIVGPETDDHGLPFAGVIIDRRVLTSVSKLGVISHGITDAPSGSDLLRWHNG